MKEIKLSTGKKCPRCQLSDSLEIYFPIGGYSTRIFDKYFHCVALCGMDFGLKRVANGKIAIGFNEENKKYLKERFKF